jgi:hypothetical protein
LSGSDASEAHVSPQAVVPPGHPHVDERQTCVAAHALLQLPQLRGSAVVSTHASSHAVNGATHAPTHWAAWHMAVAPVQAVPQAPQLSGSVASSLHASLHTASPCGHTQVPAVQLPGDGHPLPHLPQFAGSLDSSTQAEAHRARPTAHADWHVPLEQVSPAAHTRPHDPQFFASLVVSVQTLAHDVWLPEHCIAGGRPHSPPMHVYPAPQSELLEQSEISVSPPQERMAAIASAWTKATTEKRGPSGRMATSRRTMTRLVCTR